MYLWLELLFPSVCGIPMAMLSLLMFNNSREIYIIHLKSYFKKIDKFETAYLTAFLNLYILVWNWYFHFLLESDWQFIIAVVLCLTIDALIHVYS